MCSARIDARTESTKGLSLDPPCRITFLTPPLLVNDAKRTIDLPLIHTLSTGSIADILFLTGAVALAMAVLGIYPVTSYAVVQQTRTIGIQLALGASPERVYFDTLKRGLWLVGTGLFLGLALGALLELLVNPSFWGVSPFAIPVYAGTVIVFSFVGLAACHQASWRGARVEPAVALRACTADDLHCRFRAVRSAIWFGRQE